MSHFTPTVYNRPKFPPEDAKYGGLERSPVLALSLPLQTAWYQEVTLNTQMHGSEAPRGVLASLTWRLLTESRGLPRTFRVQGCNPWGASESPATQAAPGPVESESLSGGTQALVFQKVR